MAENASPTASLLWREFEGFTLLYTKLRVHALVQLGFTTIKVKDYYHHATVSVNLRDVELKLANRTYYVLNGRWPRQDADIPAYGTVTPDELAKSLFLNAAGAVCDGFEFVEVANTSPKRFLVFAHQNKHTASGRTNLRIQTIIDEMRKVEQHFSDWKSRIASVRKFAKFANSEIVLVVYSNRHIAKPRTGAKLPTKNLIIVNQAEHFGPLQPVLKFFGKSPHRTPGTKPVPTSM